MGLENVNTNKDFKEDPGLTNERKRKEFNAMITDRPLSTYEDRFDVKFSEMAGKKVLDIGAGRGIFYEEASKLGVKVFSISPDLRNPKSSLISKVGDDFSVAARAQQMPFPENTFDYEFALYSVPFYLPKIKEECVKLTDEIARTLKKNGKAYLFPVRGEFKSFLDEILQERLEKLSYAFKDDVLVIRKK